MQDMRECGEEDKAALGCKREGYSCAEGPKRKELS